MLGTAARHQDRLAAAFVLDLGQSFKRAGGRYEVVGRLRYDEEESLPTLLYLLYHPRRGSLWLSSYEGHWDLAQASRVLPDGDALGLQKGDRLRSHDGSTWLLAGKGTYRLTYVDGALPWVAEVGDRIDYAELVAADGSGETYEVEYPGGGQELETGRGRLLSYEDVCRATGLELPRPPARRENLAGLSRDWRGMKWAAAIALMVSLVAFLFAAASGREVLDQRLPADELHTELLSEPFEVRRDGSVIKLILEAPLDNAWMSIDLGLVRDDGAEPRVVHVADRDLEYYHGVEGGERWSEGTRKKSQYLRLDSAGTYRLLVRAVSGSATARSSERSYVPLRVRVLDGARQPMWTFLAALFSLVALIIIAAQHHKWRTADDE